MNTPESTPGGTVPALQEDQERQPTTQYDAQYFQDPCLPPTEDNEFILSAYQDTSVVPHTTPNRLMVTGTNGQGLWQRYWSHIAHQHHQEEWDTANDLHLNGHLRPGAIRAMCFSQDLSEPHREAFLDTGTNHYALTPEGQRQRALFIQTLQQVFNQPQFNQLPNPLEDPDTPMTRFAARHPDWTQRYHAIHQPCHDGLQLGQHLTFIGILQEDPATLAAGRSIMQRAVNTLQNSLEDDQQGDNLLSQTGCQEEDQEPSLQQDPGALAQRRARYVARAADTWTAESPRNRPEAIRFLAQAVAARDAGAARRQTVLSLHTLGDQHDLPATYLRELADTIFSNTHPTTGNISQALTLQDTHETIQHYQALQETQQAIMAIAYACHHDPGNLSWPLWQEAKMDLWNIGRMTQDNPDPGYIIQYIQAMIDQVHQRPHQTADPDNTAGPNAIEHLRAHVHRDTLHSLEIARDAVQRTHANNWQQGDFTPDHANFLWYHLRKGAALTEFTHPGRLEECLRTAARHQGWAALMSRLDHPCTSQ